MFESRSSPCMSIRTPENAVSHSGALSSMSFRKEWVMFFSYGCFLLCRSEGNARSHYYVVVIVWAITVHLLSLRKSIVLFTSQAPLGFAVVRLNKRRQRFLRSGWQSLITIPVVILRFHSHFLPWQKGFCFEVGAMTGDPTLIQNLLNHCALIIPQELRLIF